MRNNRVHCFRPLVVFALSVRNVVRADLRDVFAADGRPRNGVAEKNSVRAWYSLSFGGIISGCQHIPLGSQSTDFMKTASGGREGGGLSQRALSAPETESQNR